MIEINEACWRGRSGLGQGRVNVNGATGTKLMATCSANGNAPGGRYGLRTMCEGGGQPTS